MIDDIQFYTILCDQLLIIWLLLYAGKINNQCSKQTNTKQISNKIYILEQNNWMTKTKYSKKPLKIKQYQWQFLVSFIYIRFGLNFSVLISLWVELIGAIICVCSMLFTLLKFISSKIDSRRVTNDFLQDYLQNNNELLPSLISLIFLNHQIMSALKYRTHCY